jgi:hypothetical protein
MTNVLIAFVDLRPFASAATTARVTSFVIG